jgi:FkbM family methyltransferase
MSMKTITRGVLARQHGRLPFSLFASACEKYLRAYNNISNWDISVNGEGRALSQILKATDGGDVFDVGANVGEWAAAALRSMNRTQRLHCFEVVPSVRSILHNHLAPWQNCVIINDFGLGASNGAVTFNFDKNVNTITSKFPLVYKNSDQIQLSARITKGDSYISERAVTDIAMLKIDVEGMELDVLQGFEASFTRKIIKAVQFEHGPSHVLSAHTLYAFIEFFKQFEFKVFEVFPQRLIPVTYNFSKENYDGRNYMAFSKEMSKKLQL